MKIRSAIDAYDRKQEPYVVAYLDVLGMTKRIKDSIEKQTESLNVIHNLFTYIYELSDPKTGIKKYSDIKFKAFSDNIIIAKRLSHNRVDDIETLLGCVSSFLCASVGDGVCWLVRGGITLGDFFIDDTVVWGPALLRAYEMEDKNAIYPLVLLDAPIVELLENEVCKTDYLRFDSDGMAFLNYMSIWHYAGQFVSWAFDKMKKEAQNPDGTYSETIYKKLLWHMNYINKELDMKDEKKDRKYRLSM